MSNDEQPDDSPDQERHDDDVGYGKPPMETRFQPGQSGNPGGRPKKAKDLQSLAAAFFAESVVVKVGGRAKKMSKAEAMIQNVYQQGMTKNPYYLFRLIEILRLVDATKPGIPGLVEGRDYGTLVVPGMVSEEEWLARAERYGAMAAKAKKKRDGET